MKTYEIQLAAKLLADAADEYANHRCNDWNFPDLWALDQKTKFVREYHDWNGDPEEFNENFLHIPDYAVMKFMAHKLLQ